MKVARTTLAMSLLLFASLSHATWLGPWGNPVAVSFHGYPTALIPDGAGGVLVAYQGATVPGGPAIRLQRVTADGEVAGGWPVDGVVACSLATTAIHGTLRGVGDKGVSDLSSPVIVEAYVNDQGEVYDYRIVSGPTDEVTRSEVENILLFSVFEPARFFGQPVRGLAVINFSGVSVRG